jgi:hypothetical protein
LLSTAVALVYAYGIGVPVLFWLALRYAGISEGWAMAEAMTVWGYSMFVWIPVSVRAICFAYGPQGQFANKVGSDPLHHSDRPSSLDIIWYWVRRVGLFPRGEHLPGPCLCTSSLFGLCAAQPKSF